ncbi:COP1-INTERACTING PROTEIN-RELATED [Salix purpurea]|uniref:COP1-INTERACTING PROTEIN-RELATED n=1 Tax=Salix purpurea TaxID=77065 RepID=A0A9Q0Z951_SALPP|nr:COP1-INTERACTING PROTEIN-RELATED [Salix purpurea]
MKSSTRLDSAIFQLTPTRTRCDLIICVNEKIEKVASGLVQPFLDHLKTAQDQVARGGYSIILEPESDATWFTKGTVERFVRFVSTPEALERVYNLESEILQIEKGIAIQSNNDMGLSSVESHQAKPVERIEGSKPLTDSSEEKAIVLYKPGSHPHEANGSTVQEGKFQIHRMPKSLLLRRFSLLKFWRHEKASLQKEQGMAFARAVAAGFDIDQMTHLISFAECFGALRLMDASVRFMELWKRKHETGQWVEIEGAEAMSSRSDFSSMNASGIVLSNTINKQWPETPDGKRKAGAGPSADERPPTDQQPSPGQQEYFQGQFPHPMFPPWPIHSPPGTAPVFPGYPMQGIPYYQNYPGNSPATLNLKAWEVDALRTRSQDETEEKETSGGREPGRKGSRSGKRQSGTVVIRNINYITSKRQDASNSESQSASGSENDEEDEVLLNTTLNAKHRNSLRSSKSMGSHKKTVDKLKSSDVARTSYGKEDDGGHWKAFQNYLLKDADEAEHAVDQGMNAMEKNAHAKRRQNIMGDDPLVIDGRDPGDIQERDVTDTQKISGNWTRMTNASKDELLISRKMGQPNDGTRFVNGQMDLQSAEIDGGRCRYRMNTNDDFVILGRENKPGYRSSSSDPLAVNGFETAKK